MQDQYQALIQPFLDYLRFEKRFSQHTVISYQTDLQQFFTYLTDQYQSPAVNDIATVYIRSWLASMKQDKMTAKSINRKISCLKSFFKYHLRLGNLSATPMWSVITPKVNKRLPEFVKESDITNMFEHQEFPENWKGKTDRLLLMLFYQTGMRLSELINLKENQVDGSKKSLKILGKGNKERVVPVSEEVILLLKDYRAAKRKELENFDQSILFVLENGKKLYPKYVYLSHFTTLNKKSPHILRHTFATHLTNNGADLNAVKELLGHSSLASTQVYTHNSIEKLKEAHKKAHPKA
jgi:integrase/recombinase XerC